MNEFADSASYEKDLEQRSVLPQGFRAFSVPLQFYPKEKKVETPYNMNLSAIVLTKPSEVFAGVFTKNKAPGAPVIIGRELLKSKKVRGVLVNNKIANVCAPGGRNAAARTVRAFSSTLGCGEKGLETEAIFPSSTGIIGWELPVDAMETAAAELAKTICSGSKEKTGSMYPVAKGIMTTDAYAKVRSVDCGPGRIVAAAKGAGMIEPNMGTMLVFITTDISLSRDFTREVLPRVVEKTFNCISIDGDQSTSDTALLFSSCRVEGVDEAVFEEALSSLCIDLAGDIVRNGEGANHVIRVMVHGAETVETAKGFGKAVVNSPLVKTAIYGNDPNLGRIIMALGDYAGNNGHAFLTEVTQIRIGEVPVFRDGAFILNEEKEAILHSYLTECSLGEKKDFPPHEKTVDIDIDLNLGQAEAVTLGSDLSYEYVRENADYRT